MDNSLTVQCVKCKVKMPIYKGFTVFSEHYSELKIRVCKKCNRAIGKK